MGIDPGIATVGYGIISFNKNSYKPVAYGSIVTKPEQSVSKRLKIIYDQVLELVAKYKPETAAVEELFFNTNAKTAIVVGQARGVLMLAAENMGLEVYEYTPLQVKQALTGYGRADKKQMQQIVKILLRLEQVPKPDDTADALAVAICHANSYVMNRITQ